MIKAIFGIMRALSKVYWRSNENKYIVAYDRVKGVNNDTVIKFFFYLFDAYGINNIWEAFILKKDDDNFKAVIVKIIVKIIR